MNVRMLLSLTCVLLFSCTVSRADNPVFNDPTEENSAWFAGYDKQNGNGNKRGDLAIRLRLKSQDNSDEDFTGTLIRYDHVAKFQGTEYYIPREAGGKVIISGAASRPTGAATKLRKPLRFTAAGTYVDQGKVHVVVVRGMYHSGKESQLLPRGNKGFLDARLDDRLVIHVTDKVLNAGGGGGNKDEATTAGLDTSVVFASTASCDQSSSIRLVAGDPCEEEPDIDILAEGMYEEEPMYIE